jgi:hypothetical protein
MAGTVGMSTAQGAAEGFSRGGVVGGIIGAVGGFFGGKAAQRAEIYATRANKTRRTQQLLTAAIQRREMFRQTRFARAEQLAAASAAGEYGTLSSGYGGAMGSLMSRAGSNIRFFDAFTRDEVQASFWEGKASKKAAQASNIMGITSALTSAVGAAQDRGLLNFGGGSTFNPGLAQQQVSAASNAMMNANFGLPRVSGT